MELGLQFEDVLCCEMTTGVTTAREETLETAIPDYCPDVARIVDTVGWLMIREKRWSEERFTLSGSVKATVLYTSGEATGLRSLTISVPFSWVLDGQSLSGCETICAEGRVLLAEARAVTSRKLYIKVLPEVTLTGFHRRKYCLCRALQGEATVRQKSCTLELPLLAAAAEKTFSLAQEVVPEQTAAPEELLLHRLCPAVLSAQRLGSKLMVKGELWFYVLCRGEDQSLQQYDGAVPFSQILDVAELPEEAEYTLCLSISQGDVRIVRTDSGCAFGLTAHVDACIQVWQRRSITCVADVYSTRFDAAVQRQELTIPQLSPARSIQEEAQLRLEPEGTQPFIAVTAVDCGAPELLPAEKGVSLRTTLHVHLLYLDSDGAPVSTERTVEVCAADGETGDLAAASCGRAALSFSGGACQVRLPVTFSLRCADEQTVSAITAVTLSESQREKGPSLILCRLGQGETLWDLAKRYQTDEEAIRSANQLESDEDAGKYMLLIPKIR